MTDLLLGISNGLLLLLFNLHIGVFLLLALPLLNNEDALLDLLLPELFDVLLLVVLDVLQVSGYLVQEQGTVVLVTVCHVLLVVLVLEVLELTVHERRGSEVERQRRLVRLVKEVPNIDTVRFCDEDYSWTGWRESSACIMGSVGWS